MDPNHWHDKWRSNDLGFHEVAGNQLLPRQLAALDLPVGARVLVPLCGKAEDMTWLAGRGFTVIGVELSDIAARDYFSERGVQPRITNEGTFTRYANGDVEILVGDFFEARRRNISVIDGIYDRAALVALPSQMRTRYAQHLADITNCAPQLLITFEYQQDQLVGPPFSISEGEVDRLYGHKYGVHKLEEQPVAGGLRGVPATEVAWLLR